ncbi:MAG TPA: tol-pal system protein YbgF [Gemmatimonadaceae bacterium]|nr:tol-pal system protein YbgF [Gemmatimonadaceae bacterium]
MTRFTTRMLLPVALAATGGCFATRQDVQVIQDDLRATRAEQARADSATRARLDELIAAVRASNDSVRALGERVTRMQGDLRGDLFSMGQQIINIQELTGQSQRRLQELRASLEERAQQAGVAMPAAAGPAAQPAPGAAPGAAAPAPSGGTPGPNSLFQASLDQLRRGSAGAARAGFEELLRQYPTSDVADDAQFYLGEALSAEGNAAAADSAYAAVPARFPSSSRAPTAMYKRATLLEKGGNTAAARAVLNDLVAKYPRSDEAALARERLRTLK